MGLDQYLYAERRFPDASPEADQIIAAAASHQARWEKQPITLDADYERSTRIHTIAGTLPFATDETGGGALGWRDGEVYVQITCVYWRKANAVHDWFVERVQGGVDDCGLYEVNAEALAHLRSTCQQAIEAYDAGDLALAGSTLTPRSGFFFGSTEVDAWWAEDARKTVTELERVIRLAVEARGVTFRYHSSW